MMMQAPEGPICPLHGLTDSGLDELFALGSHARPRPGGGQNPDGGKHLKVRLTEAVCQVRHVP